MFKTESSNFLPDSDPGKIDYGIEYSVYDVTPDVSIDFVSFTTEESEGLYQPCPDIGGLHKHSSVICRTSTIDPAPVYSVTLDPHPPPQTTGVTQSPSPNCEQFYSWSHTISDL